MTGTDTGFASLGAAIHGNPETAALAIGLKKVLDTIRLGAMPLGYGMRRAGENPLTATAIDSVIRRKFIQKAKIPNQKED